MMGSRDDAQKYPYLHAPQEGYVFVITYGRSGSTLLQNVLNAIDGYCIRGENLNVLYPLFRAIRRVEVGQDFSWRRDELGKPEQDRHPRAQEILGLPIDPWYGAELFDPHEFGQALCDAFVRTGLNLPQGTRVGGFKEIRFGEDITAFDAYLDMLRTHFPAARFIMHTRNHDAVLRSGWWVRKSRLKSRRLLTRLDQCFAAYADAHSDCCFMLHYNDYRDNLDALEPLFAFLNEPFDTAMVEKVLSRELVHLKTSKTGMKGFLTAVRNAGLRFVDLVKPS